MAKATADIRSLARSHTNTAVKVLAGIMQEPKAPPAARVAAAHELLDRGWGKPAQFSTSNADEFRRAMDLTDDELANIAAGSGEGAADSPVDPSQLN